MLCAYYDKTCDSSHLFEGKDISKDEDYLRYLNKYDVIYVDMTYIKPFTNHYRMFVDYLSGKITEELMRAYPELSVSNELLETMIHAVELTGNKFIMTIDEWDAPIRENPSVQQEYLEFLRTLFKSSGTTAKIFAAAYMTGILPIKKDGIFKGGQGGPSYRNHEAVSGKRPASLRYCSHERGGCCGSD